MQTARLTATLPDARDSRIVEIGGATRLDGIDLLRGLAIFLVLMNHVNIRLLIARVPYTNYLPAWLLHLLVWNGQLGVQIFFAVSGFLITSIALRRWGPLLRVNLRDFYLLRFARIAPLLLVLLAVLSGLHLAHVHNFVVTEKTGGLGRALLAALTFHVNVLEARRGYLPGAWDILWSLSVEEMFYLFFPIVCRIAGRGKLFIAILAAFVALGPFGRTVFTHGSEIWREYSYLGGMEGIAMGCLTALICSRVRFSPAVLRALAVTGSLTIATCLVFSWQFSSAWLGRAGLDMTLLGLGSCIVIAASAQTLWRSPRLLFPLVRIGRYSYEVYLTHMFVVFALFSLFVNEGKRMGFVPVLFVATILIAALVGAAVARWYSEPMNRRLRSRYARPHDALATIEPNLAAESAAAAE